MTNTTMNSSGTTQDPDAIERDIRRTQNEMSQTVDKIGDQLTMKNLFNSLLDKADENGVDAHYLVDGARRNPIALGLIAAGAIWLVSDKNSKFPSKSGGKSRGSSGSDEFGSDDIHHRDYVSHMSSVEMRDGEDPLVYQRRRDLHRATFLMCERKPEEDEGSFRQRLDDLTDKFREKRSAWSDSISSAGASTAQSAQSAARSVQQTGRQAVNRAQDMYDSNPLVGGILAAAVGAALGSTVPISRKEQETLGDFGSDAREMVSEQKDKIKEQLHDKKDQLLEKADEKLQSTSQESSGQRQPEMQGAGGFPQQNQGSGADTPFIISERDR